MKPNIAQAAQAFTEWRASRSKRSHTPAHLRELAVALVDHYPMSQICDLLGVNTRSLKVWSEQQSASQEFVTLPDEGLVPVEVPTVEKGIELKIVASGGIECYLSGEPSATFVASLLRTMQEGAA